MNRQKLFWVLLMCFGFSLVYAAAQTQPAAGPPEAAPTTPQPSAKAAAAPLPDPQTPEEFFARARQLSDLEASGIPFHLKATYVASGDTEFTGNGTYEEWWQSKDLWRKEATLGDYKYVEIESGGKLSLYGSSDYVPLRLRQMLDAVVIRIAPDAGTSREWQLKHQMLKGVDLVVLSSEKTYEEPKFKVPYVTSDYLTSGGVLRIQMTDGVEDLYNDFQPFQHLLTPRKIDVAGDGTAVLTISIPLLERLGPNEKMLARDAPLPAGVQPIRPPLRLKPGAGVRPPEPTLSPAPIFPASERTTHPHSAVVIIAGQIDTKGILREPHVLASAGPAYDRAAMDAVRKYRFRPARENGEPRIVDTNIFIDFNDLGMR